MIQIRPGQTHTSCANLSIGVMMKGMVESPMAVVVHLRTGRGHLVDLPSRYRDAAHTRLIVKPGMITEARACHTNVSTTATATRVVFPGLSPWAWRDRWRSRGGVMDTQWVDKITGVFFFLLSGGALFPCFLLSTYINRKSRLPVFYV